MTVDQRFANIDERLAFLVQSTESLHATAMEQTAQIAEHTKQLATDAEHIRALVRIVEIHEQRLSGLEEPPRA